VPVQKWPLRQISESLRKIKCSHMSNMLRFYLSMSLELERGKRACETPKFSFLDRHSLTENYLFLVQKLREDFTELFVTQILIDSGTGLPDCKKIVFIS